MAEGVLNPLAGLAALGRIWSGTCRSRAVDLDAGCIGKGILAPTAVAHTASPGDQWTVCLDATSDVHSEFGVGIGLALLTANWCFVLFAVAMIAGFVIRAPREERMMLEAFGEEYQVYMQRTGRFFPKFSVLLAGFRR